MNPKAESAIAFVMRDEIEGGYADHPEDNGGPTNMGITIGTFRRWRSDNTLTKEDLKRLTKEEAIEIYKDWYWDKVRGDELPLGLDLVVFDGAVNSGPKRSIELLQHALGVSVDGILGPITMWQARQADAKKIISNIIDIRLAWLGTLDDWKHFGRGWTNRLTMLEEEALKRVGDVPQPSERFVQDPRLLRAYRLARADIGLREIPGSQHNPEIVKWFAEVGHAYIKDDETAYCAAAVGAWLEYAGLDSTRKLNARSYADWGQETTDPKEGDIVYFWRVSPSDWRGHVGFVVEIDNANKRIKVLGANQDNMVNEKWYPMNGRTTGLLGYRTLRIEKEVEMSNLTNQPTNMPTRKVTAFAGAGVAAAFAAEPLFNWLPFLNELVAAETPEQFTTALFAVVIGFIAAWFTKERA